MTTTVPCYMPYLGDPRRPCVLPIDHDGPHVTRGGHGWHDSPDYMDGGVTAAAIEKEAEKAADCEARQLGFICTREKDHSGHHIAATVALHHSVAEVWDNRPRIDWEALAERKEKRAEKAEQERDEARRHECSDLDAHWRLDEALETIQQLARERDEARATKNMHKRRADEERARADAAESRPLGPEGITDEMVLRFMNAYDGQVGRGKPAPSLNHFTALRTSVTRNALTAALTEPPKRPEWAGEADRIKAVQDLIDQANTAGDWTVTCSRLQSALDNPNPYNASETA